MKASAIFRKTPRGQAEIKSKTDALSMKERRVLILVNGQNSAAKLKELSLCENIVDILENLLNLDFIENLETGPATDTTAGKSEPAEIEAGDFMCNTLLTFANRVRVADLLQQINEAEDNESLKALVKPWYIALSETPGGMYQADDLRKEVLAMIERDAQSRL